MIITHIKVLYQSKVANKDSHVRLLIINQFMVNVLTDKGKSLMNGKNLCYVVLMGVFNYHKKKLKNVVNASLVIKVNLGNAFHVLMAIT